MSSLLYKTRTGFWLQKESLMLIIRNPELLLYWVAIEISWLVGWYHIVTTSTPPSRLVIIILGGLYMIIQAACIQHMKNILAGTTTTIKGMYRALASIALSILTLFAVRQLLAYSHDALIRSYVSIEWYHYYIELVKNSPSNVILWLPSALFSLLLVIIVFEHVQLISACRIACKVIARCWLQIILWVLVLMCLDLVVFFFTDNLAEWLQHASLISSFFASKIILSAQSFVRFVFGLTFMVQVYNGYRLQKV